MARFRHKGPRRRRAPEPPDLRGSPVAGRQLRREKRAWIVFGAGLVLLAVLAAAAYLRRARTPDRVAGPTSLPSRCRQGYARARTAAETLFVDRLPASPPSVRGRQGTICQVYRITGARGEGSAARPTDDTRPAP